MGYNRGDPFWEIPQYHVLYWLTWLGGILLVVAIWNLTPWGGFWK